MIHLSWCALHNAPALPVGPCNCGAEQADVDRVDVSAVQAENNQRRTLIAHAKEGEPKGVA